MAALLALGIAAAVWLNRPVPPPPPPQKPVVDTRTASNTMTGTTLTVEARPAEKGQLLINALPWGEVVSVMNAAGVEQLPARQETPLLMSLPTGNYRVRLSNPHSNQTVNLDAAVKANALVECKAELDRIDAGAYVDRIGIGP